MKLRSLALLFIFTLLLGSCTVVGGIFKAGVWTGVLLVAAVIGVIIYLVTRGGNSK